jgi:hypothetical protein
LKYNYKITSIVGPYKLSVRDNLFEETIVCVNFLEENFGIRLSYITSLLENKYSHLEKLIDFYKNYLFISVLESSNVITTMSIIANMNRINHFDRRTGVTVTHTNTNRFNPIILNAIDISIFEIFLDFERIIPSCKIPLEKHFLKLPLIIQLPRRIFNKSFEIKTLENALSKF